MTLYLTDLDGTLLRSDKSLSEYTVNTLNRLIGEGARFSYATARSYASAASLVERLNLTCPAVLFNGVFVADPQTGKHLAENVYSAECMELAREFFTREEIAPLTYSFIDGKERVSYLKSQFAAVESYVNSHHGDKRLREAESFKELFAGKIFYFTVLNPSKTELMNSVFTAENGFARNIQRDTYDNYIWYEISDKSASKANAAKQVREMVGADSLICFGDNINDISMIKSADTGIAVENACEELKHCADLVVESNDNDGVARFIERNKRK